jgi:hypothetical protein
MRINQIVPITLVSFLIMSGAIAQTFAHDKGEREGSDKRKEEWRIEAKNLMSIWKIWINTVIIVRQLQLK